jgi:hypothetical protein
MAYSTYSKMVFAHDNVVRDTIVSSISLDNCNEDPVNIADNLKYEDPGLFFGGDPTGGTVQVDVVFSPGKTAGAIGLLGHNLYSMGYTSVRPYMGPAPPGTISIGDAITLNSDADILVGFGAVTNAVWGWRFYGSTTDFTLRSIFLAQTTYEMNRNPVYKSTVEQFTVPTVFSESSGDVVHVVKTANRMNAELKLDFRRLIQTDVNYLYREIFRKEAGHVIGIIMPTETQNPGTPNATQAFFGYPIGFNHKPGPDYGEGHKSDLMLDFRGAT